MPCNSSVDGPGTDNTPAWVCPLRAETKAVEGSYTNSDGELSEGENPCPEVCLLVPCAYPLVNLFPSSLLV